VFYIYIVGLLAGLDEVQSEVVGSGFPVAYVPRCRPVCSGLGVAALTIFRVIDILQALEKLGQQCSINLTPDTVYIWMSTDATGGEVAFVDIKTVKTVDQSGFMPSWLSSPDVAVLRSGCLVRRIPDRKQKRKQHSIPSQHTQSASSATERTRHRYRTFASSAMM